MNRGRGQSGGYTIIETMIFLAISGAMVVAVIVLLSGQQHKTQFSQAVREFESRLQDVSNDVSTGFSAYPFDANTECWYNGSSLQIGASAPPSATRCIFVGRAIQFSPDNTSNDSASKYIVHTLIGRQRDSDGREVTSLAAAKVQTLDSLKPESTQEYALNYGARFGKVTYTNGATSPDIGSLAFTTTFQQYGTSGLNSGTTSVNVLPFQGSRLGDAVSVISQTISDDAKLSIANPDGGVTLCLISGNDDQHAFVRMGADGAGRLAVTSEIITGGSCS